MTDLPTIDAIASTDAIDRELELIRNRHGVKPLVTSARDAALVELASPIPSVRWRAKQVVKKPTKRKAVSGSKHYMRVRKSLKKRVYTFYWSHQQERCFHTWKHNKGEHVFLTLEEWVAIKEAALARGKQWASLSGGKIERSSTQRVRWALKKRDYNRCWTWNNVYVLIDKYRALDPRAELERPESCPRPDSRFNQPEGQKKGGRPRRLD